MTEIHSGGIQDSLQIQHHLTRFGSNVLIVELTGSGVNTNLTGDEQFVSF
jgi:hypothetical protein